jgi:pimeloyl-ACP methyl ester carboxylesterase
MMQPLLKTSEFIDLEGLRIKQAVAGNGSRPLLMLHGWGANIDLLHPFAQRLVPLDYTCYMLDLPGFGQSSPPPVAWRVSDYVKLVVRYMDLHDLDKVYLFGHSFGGRLSLVLGADYSDRIIRMALADSAGVRPKPSSGGSLRLRTYRFARETLEKIGLKSQANALREWYNNRYASADYKAVKGVMRETFIQVVNEDLLPYAARIKPPALLFWGDQDTDTPLWQGQLLEKTIPDAGLVVWEGAGHYSYLDKLADTARVMDYFFKN